MRGFSVTTLLLAVLAASSVRAEPATKEALRAALYEERLALDEYGLISDNALGSLRNLGELASEPSYDYDVQQRNAAIRREAAYLRAAVATDLLVIAAATPEQVSLERLSAAYGAPPEQLLQRLRADLSELDRGPFRGNVAATLQSLQLTEAANADPRQLLTARGLHRDFLLAKKVATALDSSEPEAELGELGGDPCEGNASCPEPFTHFDAPGRRAMWLLREAGRALQRLQEAAERGAPFARAVMVESAIQRVTLDQAVLAPEFRLDQQIGVVPVSQDLPNVRPQAIILVGPDSVAFSFVPRVRLDDKGGLELVAQGEPVFPQVHKLSLPASFRPYMTPIDALAGELKRRLASHSGCRVAVGAYPDVASDVVARVLLSLREVGDAQPLLLAREAASGRLQALPLEIVREAQDSDRSALSLRVRLGGYSLKKDGGLQDIPRVRTDEGFRFDTDALAQALSGERVPAAAVSFMYGVRSEPLLAAAFRVASASRSVQLLIP